MTGRAQSGGGERRAAARGAAGGGELSGVPASAVATAVDTVVLDLPALVAAFARRLHAEGVPVPPERSARFADALALVRPVARTRLYWTARATLVSEHAQVAVFDRVFRDVFGSRIVAPEPPPPDARRAPADSDERPTAQGGSEAAAGAAPSVGKPGAGEGAESAFGVTASDEERLRDKRFDDLDAAELAVLYRLMARLRVAPPPRRLRRAEHARHGERIDLRRTLRGSLRSGGDPIHLARRRRRVRPRRLVLLCDISGSMEPYARAYLQFLSCAGPRSEAFVFATRLTRITRALATRSPERALRRAAVAAPDWSSGTRIGDALRAFNDGHGRRGMARGAVVVILSDGWERGDPALVAREMERLSRLAYRIVWVNPRVAARGFVPRAGGMAAALPHVDALVSGHTLAALAEVVDEIAAARTGKLTAPDVQEEETWASATPTGAMVSMPMGRLA